MLWIGQGRSRPPAAPYFVRVGGDGSQQACPPVAHSKTRGQASPANYHIGCHYSCRSNSGSRAMFVAIRRASSRVRIFACIALAGGVAHDLSAWDTIGSPWGRDAAGGFAHVQQRRRGAQYKTPPFSLARSWEESPLPHLG